MFQSGLFLVMFSQVLLKKTCDPDQKKCDPLGKLRKQLKMPDKSSSVFRSDGNFDKGQIYLRVLLHSTADIKLEINSYIDLLYTDLFNDLIKRINYLITKSNVKFSSELFFSGEKNEDIVNFINPFPQRFVEDLPS